MKTDEIEKRLERLSLRNVPVEWRGEILDAARRARDPQLSTLNPQQISWWRDWLWPCPQAWACLAAAWVVVLLLNLASRDPVRVAKASKPAPAPEFFMALREHRRLLAELIGPPPFIEPHKPFAPRPRGEISHPALADQFA